MNLHPVHVKQSANLFLWAVRNHFSEGNLSGIMFAVRLGIDSPLNNHEQYMYSLHILWRCVQVKVQAAKFQSNALNITAGGITYVSLNSK